MTTLGDAQMKKISNVSNYITALDVVNKKCYDNATITSLRERIPVKVKDSAAYSFRNNCITKVAPLKGKSVAVNVAYLE